MDTAKLSPNELLAFLICAALKRQQRDLKLTDKQVSAIMYVIAPILGDDTHEQQHSHRAR